MVKITNAIELFFINLININREKQGNLHTNLLMVDLEVHNLET